MEIMRSSRRRYVTENYFFLIYTYCWDVVLYQDISFIIRNCDRGTWVSILNKTGSLKFILVIPCTIWNLWYNECPKVYNHTPHTWIRTTTRISIPSDILRVQFSCPAGDGHLVVEIPVGVFIDWLLIAIF